MRRTTVVSTKVSETEALRVEVAARLAGVTRSELLRSAVLERVGREVDGTRARGRGGGETRPAAESGR